MEVMLRCSVPDRPGALALLAGTIGQCGGDIQAVDVVEHEQGLALDDLVVVFDDPQHLSNLVERIRHLDHVELIHVGPSRGHPGDAVTRLAVGLEAILSGAMTLEHGVRALLGGLLRASSADVVDGRPPSANDKRLVLEVGDQHLVVQRDYRFTSTERDRAEATLRVALAAARSLREALP
jgi:ACT domain-containing protein